MLKDYKKTFQSSNIIFCFKLSKQPSLIALIVTKMQSLISNGSLSTFFHLSKESKALIPIDLIKGALSLNHQKEILGLLPFHFHFNATGLSNRSVTKPNFSLQNNNNKKEPLIQSFLI